MTRIAVLGCGRIGKMHAANIAKHPGASLAGVFDIHQPAADALSAELGATCYASADDAFADPNADAVLIATSTDTHADFIEQGVAAGKPMLCEKPIDLSVERVLACQKAIAGTTVPIMLGFVRRFDPGHKAVYDAVRDGTLGELHQVVITSRDPGMPPPEYTRVSGGIFRDMTIHDFDMARYILGEEPVSVMASGSRLVDPALMNEIGDYDTVTVVLETASGKQAIITNSRQAVYGYDQRVEALGTKGMAVSENQRPHATTLHTAAFTNRAEPLQNFFIERYTAAFDAEIDEFAAAIAEKREPAVGFEDGVRALVLAEAAMRSVAEKRSVLLSEFA